MGADNFILFKFIYYLKIGASIESICHTYAALHGRKLIQ